MLLRQAHRSDDGVGMVLVIGITVFILALISTGAILATNSLKQAGKRDNFEKAMAAAEQGLDETTSRLQVTYDSFNVDLPVPTAPSAAIPNPPCVGTPVTSPASFASEAAERDWAMGQLRTLATDHPECIKTTETGQYLVMKPKSALVDGRYTGMGRIYSIGWSPSRTDPSKSTRLLKSEYKFTPYQPTAAIMTQGNLTLSSSTKIRVVPGYGEGIGGVHSNSVLNCASMQPVNLPGKPSSGLATTATCAGKTILQVPKVGLPVVSARTFYFHAPNTDPTAVATRWYDLCPDGTVKSWSSSGPCTGPIKSTASAIGWTFTPSSRTWSTGTGTVSGVYYAHEGNILGDRPGTVANLTAVAASASPTDCANKLYGNITWKNRNITAPAFKNLFFYADADVLTESGFNAGSLTASGLIIAGDQVQMTSNSSGAYGSVVATDLCTTSTLVTRNDIQSGNLVFDPNGASPFTDVITNTGWLEFTGANW